MDKPRDRFATYAQSWKEDPLRTVEIANDLNAWQLFVTSPDDGSVFSPPPGSDISMHGFAGTVKLVVALGKDGRPIYDKVIYEQNPGVAIVVWGRDDKNVVKIVYLTQVRPFARDPCAPEREDPLVFGQIPMGFLKPEDVARGQSGIEDAVRRELTEEAGVKQIISIELPDPLIYWQDPTLISNGTYVAFAETVLATASGKTEKAHDGEQIQHVEFITVPELLARIARGRTPDGVIHHMGLSLGPVMMFFARHPELLRDA